MNKSLLPVIAYGLCLACLACGGGCKRTATDTLLKQAFALGEKYQWQEAMPLVKQFLLSHPDDPAGHFLLGRCYLHNASPHLVLAKGEFETALVHLQQTQEHNGLSEILTANQLGAAIHRELARTMMRWSREAMQAGFPGPIIEEPLRHALDEVKKGLELDPDSKPLKEMEETLKPLLEHNSHPGNENSIPPMHTTPQPSTHDVV
ncbi:MAG TPA: hypothetical protein PLI09_01525 [Candidatus Hydrogenedentes bacterium]|nr:hypothetical protein [Candidatus Hydrogenedentota bacterium]